jgi:hypothetical protein
LLAAARTIAAVPLVAPPVTAPAPALEPVLPSLPSADVPVAVGLPRRTIGPKKNALPEAAFSERNSPAGTRPDGLSDEVASLYAIKEALDEHDPKKALQKLDAHEQRFVSGNLKTEIAVLRIETLFESGDHARAARLAQALIDESPNGPYAHRIRSLLESRRSVIDPDGGGQY